MRESRLPMWVQRTPDEDAWVLYYGSYDGIEAIATNEVQGAVQDHLGYVIEIRNSAQTSGFPKGNAVLVGTPKTNPLIASLVEKGAIAVPAHPESYAIACIESPWAEGKRLIVAAGHDPKGTLNGAHGLAAEYLGTHAIVTGTSYTPKGTVLDNLPLFNASEKPAVDRRGIWTWGDVIYDYRGIVDNLARLRMNYLLIWNNIPPINCEELIAYAHSRGVQVVLGFSWGWGVDFDLGSADDREQMKTDIVEHYLERYAHLGMDGIYCQTPTEYVEGEIGGETTASIVCDLLNRTARGILEKTPDLTIWAGIHAKSIGENYVDFKALDDRVFLMWEDAGALPFSFVPVLDCAESTIASAYHTPGKEKFEDTLDYCKRLATFRPGTDFAIVPKGLVGAPLTTTGWGGHSSYIIGERSRASIRTGMEKIRREMDYFNHLWLQLYPHAVRFYKEVLDCKPAGMTVAGLVNDVMFEARIEQAVSLLAEMLWNPDRAPEEILRLAISPYYVEAP